MYSKTLAGVLLCSISACGNGLGSDQQQNLVFIERQPLSPIFKQVAAIPPPPGYIRKAAPDSCFTTWLRNLELKEDKTVYLFNGQKKRNQEAQFAVLDISVGTRNLQQCADAVIRLRAEFLYSKKRFSEIRFTDNAGTVYQFSPPFTMNNFQQYLQRVFGMCGSASLSKQLRQTKITNLSVGDVFVRGGFPGHAAIVIDMAENNNGAIVYLLAQSYMPAQDIHILKNPAKSDSPWYQLNEDDMIITPEFHFRKTELRRW